MQDRLGRGYTELEIFTCLRKRFLARSGATLRPTTSTGKYAWSRHPENRLRGDKGSVDSKKESIETFSLRLDWRAAPAVVEHEDVSRIEEYRLVDWGGLSDGREAAMLGDPQRKNRRVQAALVCEIPGCDVWRRNVSTQRV